MIDNNFKSTIEILNDNKIDYWLCHGTLLGIVRDKELIAWDNDIDIAFFEKKINKNQILDLFQKQGFKKKKKFFKNDGLMTMIKKGGKEVDFNFYKFDKTGLNVFVNWYIPKNNVMKTIHAISMGEKYEGKFKSIIKKISILKKIFKKLMSLLIYLGVFYKKAGYSHPHSLIKNKSILKFYGLPVKVPKNHEIYLKYLYGLDWKTPKRNFNWLKDSPATKIFKEEII